MKCQKSPAELPSSSAHNIKPFAIFSLSLICEEEPYILLCNHDELTGRLCNHFCFPSDALIHRNMMNYVFKFKFALSKESKIHFGLGGFFWLPWCVCVSFLFFFLFFFFTYNSIW